MRKAVRHSLLLLAAIALPSSCAQFDRTAADRPRASGLPHDSALPADGATEAVTQAAHREPIEAEDRDEPLQIPPAPAGSLLSPDDGEPAERASLTLNDLEQMALESNPTLQQLAATVEKARGIRRQVGLHPNPTIAYSGEEIGDDGTAGLQGGFISQTIVTGDKLKWNRDVAGWDIEALAWEYQAQQYRVINDVRLRYFDVLGAQRRVGLGEDLVRVAGAGVKTAEDLLEARQGARPDVLQARVDFNEVRIALENARLDHEAAWKRLAAVLGLPELSPAPLAGELEDHVPPRDWESTLRQLLDGSPELQAARIRVQRAQTQIRRQELQPIPNVLAQLGVAHNNASGDEVAHVQVGIPLPVFNRNQGNIALAQSDYYRAIRDVERLELNLQNRLAVAFRDFRQAAQQVERYQRDIVPTARENLNLTEEGHTQGEFDFLRVLTARRSYFEANLRYVGSLIALRKADVLLSGLLLTGGLDDVADVSSGLGGVGQRDQALSQQ